MCYNRFMSFRITYTTKTGTKVATGAVTFKGAERKAKAARNSGARNIQIKG